jgi:hypothetical protein
MILRAMQVCGCGLSLLTAIGLGAPPADTARPGAEAKDHAAPAPPPRVEALIADLDDPRYQVRERATRLLLKAGETALDQLLTAANGDRPEPADRAIWILRKLGQNGDPFAARLALERLVQVRGRSQVVSEAKLELARVSLELCQRKLEGLGAEVSAQLEQIPPGLVIANVVQVRLGDKWRGTTEDLRPLAEETHHQCFRLVGPAIDDAVVKLFEAKEDLAYLQLIDSKVTVAAVDSLKELRPSADLYLRNKALLGVQAEGRGAGVAVVGVPAGTAAAAAGIVAGDVIVALDGQVLPDFDRLTAHIAQHEPGDKVQVEIQRGAQKQTLEVTLGSWANGPTGGLPQ